MEKQTYYILPGVDQVNGKPVPPDRKIDLTETEAMYDLAHGRISSQKPASSKKDT